MTTIAVPKVGATWRTILLSAAEVIRKEGHAADHGHGEHGEVCTVVALARASISLGVDLIDPRYEEAKQAVHREIGFNAISLWNREQTAANVIDTFERAALK